MPAIQDMSGWAKQQGRPATLGIIASFIGVSLLFWFTQSKGIEQLALTINSHERPWSLVAYPWALMPFSDPFGILFFVFALLWLYMAGGLVEKQLGTAKYLFLWLAITAGVGIWMWAGMQLAAATRYAVVGLYLPLGVITVVWCARNLTTQIMLYGIIPLSGKWLAVAAIVVTLLVYGSSNILMGVLAAAAVAVFYLWALDRLPFLRYSPGVRAQHATRAQARYDDRYYDDVKQREKERDERERLRKLFEGSMKDDQNP